jgi:hypothetical protein
MKQPQPQPPDDKNHHPITGTGTGTNLFLDWCHDTLGVETLLEMKTFQKMRKIMEAVLCVVGRT